MFGIVCVRCWTHGLSLNYLGNACDKLIVRYGERIFKYPKHIFRSCVVKSIAFAILLLVRLEVKI